MSPNSIVYKRCILAALTVALAGCDVPIRAVRVGPPQLAKPANCPMEFSQTAPEEISARYTRVGSICISGTGQLEWQREELQRMACWLGGEVVTATASCYVNKLPGTEFAVLRQRPPAP